MKSIPHTLLLGLALGPITLLGWPTVATAAPRLTCSFIHKQCLKECTPKATPGFCKLHCDGERRRCLETGTWNSFGREFRNVLRR